MHRQTVEHLQAVLEEVGREYLDGHSIVFGSQQECRRSYFESVARSTKQWKTARKCIVPSCDLRSVCQSHSIARSRSLASIAEKGHLVTPTFSSGRVEAKHVGLQHASTFPGFCPHHERMFFDQERVDRLSEPKHILLQLYRAVCREIVRLEHQLDGITASLREFCQRRDQWCRERVLSKLGREYFEGNQLVLEKLSFQSDGISDGVERTISAIEDDLRELKHFHLFELEHALISPESSSIAPIAITLGEQMPLALSGMGVFHIDHNKLASRVIVFMNVLPYIDKTEIVLFGRSVHSSFVRGYLAARMTPIGFLNMIESWMIHGTDHWFLRPSVWNGIPPKRKRLILDKILDVTKGITDVPDFSIFDDLRRNLLDSERKRVNAGEGRQALMEQIRFEEGKLTSCD